MNRSLKNIAVLATFFLGLVLSPACGDNTAPPDTAPDAPPFTWGDAEQVWAESWCAYAERCYPVQFAGIYGSQATCVQRVRDANCVQSARGCGTAFPEERRGWLEQCAADMQNIHCSVTQAPTSCLAVWQ